jgi:DNA-binding NtrC family response regulator
MLNSTVFIIDDEPDLANICSAILTQEGYQVEKCTDSEQGLELIKAKPFDLIIVDLIMPKINGLQILREAKALHPECEVIITTGYPSIESAVTSMKEGAFDYLVKPFMSNQLTTMAAQALSRKRSKEKKES